MPYKDLAQRWACKKRQMERRIFRNRAFVNGYKSTFGCVDCGENNPSCLDFDHRNGCIKKACIAVLCSKANAILTLLKEMEKCDVRCANCHRKRHTQERQQCLLLV